MDLSTSLFILISLTLLQNIYCQSGAVCHSNEFKCDSGKCIPSLWRCDGTSECDDKSDEKACPGNCTSGTFFCEHSNICIKNSKKCNGIQDCSMGEDERDCGKNRCKSSEFRCHTHKTECIDKSQVCDYIPQCSDKSDEFKESCQSVNKIFKGEVCEEDTFLCKADETCIDNSYRCNGYEDCLDGSDEVNCAKSQKVKANVKCNPGELVCEVSNSCIDVKKICDGNNDCVNGVDERNCSRTNTSEIKTCIDKRSFNCGLGNNCLPMNKVCNGFNDCPNGADELDCTNCTADMFKCGLGSSCVSMDKRCDGKVDCLDKSDELNCTASKPAEMIPCDAKKFFDCDGTGRQCVPLSKVCDSHPDCEVNDGADEKLPKCRSHDCDIKNGGCAHNCSFDFKLKQKTCSCRKGFMINPKDHKDCIDINECKIWGTCSHFCKNTIGSYQCECPAGYVRDIDRRRCVVIGEKSLMFTTGIDVREYKFAVSEVRPVVHGLSNAVGFDIDQTKKPYTFYWSSIGGSIHRFNLATSGLRLPLYSEANSVPDGLMLDWTNELLYWTDTGLDRIQVMNLSSGHHHILLEGHKWMDEPRAIVLDPTNGWLYWSDWSDGGAKISMMGMNGDEPNVILNKSYVQYPNALALDSIDHRLYYGDAKLSKIGCIDLTRRTHRDILIGQKIHPFAMSVFEDRIYWSDWIWSAVLSTDKFFGKEIVVVVRSSKPMTLRMIHPSVQLPILGRCHNHKCSHICLPAPSIKTYRYSCACPRNMKLKGDQRTCSTLKSKGANRFPLHINLRVVSKVRKSLTNSPEVGMVAGVTTGVIITVAVLAAMLGVFLYGMYSRRAQTRTRTMVFDNNGLIKTNEDLYELTRSSSLLASRSSSMLKRVPTSSQLLWASQTNTEIMEDMLRYDPNV